MIAYLFLDLRMDINHKNEGTRNTESGNILDHEVVEIDKYLVFTKVKQRPVEGFIFIGTFRQ